MRTSAMRSIRHLPRLQQLQAFARPSRNLALSNKHDYYEQRHQIQWKQDWITREAEEIMTRTYARHNSLGDRSAEAPPRPSIQELESLGVAHYPPQNLGDRFAHRFVTILKPFTHAFFREKYNHHALVLETVAAVPGMVAGMFRHLRSLRRMKRDHGWIHPLLEEAENERMHLLIWMTVTQPTLLEKALVVAAQAGYATLYTFMYALAPRVAHRFVGYLEEEAVSAYTDYLNAIDKGAIPNQPAPEIAKRYYRLDDDATVRDVILHVRGDECMHRNVNHRFADMLTAGAGDQPPQYPPPVEEILQRKKEQEKSGGGDDAPLPEAAFAAPKQ